MFTTPIRLLVITITLCGYLVNGNITIVTPTTSSTVTKTTKNITCEEFCAIPHNYERDDATQHLVVGDQSSRLTSNSISDLFGQQRFRFSMNEDYLKRSSIIFGLTQLANEDHLTKNCYGDLKEIAKAVLRKDIWAMKVLDSSGTKESGFLWGQNYWLGSKHGCEAVQNPVYITLSDQYEREMKMGLINEVAPFPMEYRMLYVKHNSPWQVEIKFMSERIIHIGLCLPNSCDNNEIYNLTQTYLEQGIFEEENIYDIQPKVIHMKDLKLTENFMNQKSLKMLTAVILFTIIMLTIAMCQDTATDEKKSSSCEYCDRLQKMYSGNIHSSSPDSVESHTVTNHVEKTYLQKFVKCYDLIENCKSLFSLTTPTSNSIPVINGLRSVSCLWILIFHVMWYMYFTVDNKIFLISYGERVFFQYVSTAPLLVDVFFTISGFLLSYNFLKNENNIKQIRINSITENAKNIGKIIFHRYLRLGPMYLVVTAMVAVFTAYIEDVSIFHIHERYDQTCSKYWWRNIFFIQNFFHQDQLCLNWTWSLACEMQFFIIVTLLLFLYAKYPETAKSIVILGIISSAFWTYIIGVKSQYKLSFDVIYETGTDIYINPFVRIMPYLIGASAGWFLAKNEGRFEVSPGTDKCLWNLAILVFFGCIYSTIKRDMSFFLTISLLIVGRFSFSASVSWMILGSATGRGVWWSRFLEWSVFQHINKLSYAIYLLNPFVIGVVFSLAQTSTHADPILLSVLTVGFVVIVYICSIVFSLSFEIPYCNLSSLLLRRKFKQL